MNHLAKRCGCGKIFTLPNLKSRESRCASCLRPPVAHGPAQVQHALTCLFLFAGELSARGWHRKRDRARQRAKRTPAWAGATVSFPTWAGALKDLRESIRGGSDQEDAMRYAWQAARDGRIRGGHFEPSSGSAADICRAVEQVRGVLSCAIATDGPAHFAVTVRHNADLYRDGVTAAIGRSRPLGVSFAVDYVACDLPPAMTYEGLQPRTVQNLRDEYGLTDAEADAFERSLIRGPGETDEALRDRVRLCEQNAYALAAR